MEIPARRVQEGDEVLIGERWVLIEDVKENPNTQRVWLAYNGGSASTSYPARAMLRVSR
jgi:hypothetical protein